MNISGIRPTAGFYSYNSIKINELRNQQLAVTTQEKAVKKESVIEQDEAPVEQTFSSFDFAQTYKPDATYELKGEDSDVSRLDVEKTLSDLEKDKVLEQYQYFVGDRAQKVATDLNTENKMPRSGENFIL